MPKKRNFYDPTPSEPYSEDLHLLKIPVTLTIPDDVADRIPRSELRLIRGRFVLRFCPLIPIAIGHTIAYKGHRWRIVGIDHEVQILRSPHADQFPEIEVEYLGRKQWLNRSPIASPHCTAHLNAPPPHMPTWLTNYADRGSLDNGPATKWANLVGMRSKSRQESDSLWYTGGDKPIEWINWHYRHFCL